MSYTVTIGPNNTVNVSMTPIAYNVSVGGLANSEITAKVGQAQAAQAAAEAAETGSVAARTATEAARDAAQGHATTAAAEAANAASAVSWQDLSGVSATLTGTWLGGTFYNTALDSDGGAWRWQNNTDFPAVVAITRDADEVVLWDAADGSEYERLDFTGFTVTSVVASEGQVIVGTSTGVVVIDYVTGEKDVALTYSTSTTPALVNNGVLSLAQTVLPDAPINPETGLPYVTTVVGTEDGLTILDGPAGVGTAVDITFTSTAYIEWVRFRSDGALVFATGGSAGSNALHISVYHKLPSSDIANGNRWEVNSEDELYSGSNTDANLFIDQSDHWKGAAENFYQRHDAVDVILPNPSFPDDSALIIMQPDNISPVMHGGTLFAGLASTDDTDLSGADLVTDGDFSSSVSNWTAHNSVISYSSGRLVVDDTANAGTNSAAYQTFSVVPGATYKIVLDVESTTQGAWLFVCSSGWLSGISQLLVDQPAGVYEVYYTATTSQIWLGLNISGTGVTEFNSVTFKRVDLDRSPKANHLDVTGTITRTAVATGADLVWHNLSADSTVTLGSDISSTGMVCWWQDVSGAPTFYCRDLSGGQDYVNNIAGTAPTTSQTFSGADMTVKASIEMALLTAEPAPLTAQQRNLKYNLERRWFEPNAVVTLDSDTVRFVAFDEALNRYHALTDTGHSVFDARTLTRISYEAGDWNWITADNGMVAKG